MKKESFVTIADLWHMCAARWRWFVASVAVCMALAVYHLATTPYMYTRTAAFMVLEESLADNTSESNTKGINDIGLVKQKSSMPNVVRHITSLDVVLEVVKRLKLADSESQAWETAKALQGRLSAGFEGTQSTVVDLTYVDYSTTEAARVLGEIIQVYIEKSQQAKIDAIKYASDFIDSRLRLLESELSNIDDSVAVFKSRYGITNLEHVSDLYLQQQNRADAEILAYTNQKAMAEYIRDLLTGDNGDHQFLLVNSGIHNSIIESQITLYNSLLMEMQSHLEYTSGQNPIIVSKQKELATLRKNILANINNHIRTIDIQLRTLEGYHDEATSKIVSNPEQAKQLTTIERDQKVKESLYLYLLQKKEENEISVTFKTSNIYVIDPPHGSGKPTSPNRFRAIVVALLLGVLVPATVLFLRASFDESVRDHYDIERYSDIPFIGEVPYSGHAHSLENLFMRLGLSHLGLGQDDKAAGIVVGHDMLNASNEAFRILRNNMEAIVANRSLGGNGGRVYLVKSTQLEAGKTFVAMNLALTKAIGGRHVLFIDGDLRQASASRLWRTELRGLTDYLSGEQADFRQLLFHPEGYPTLDVLPAGAVPTNPTELLRSPLLAQLFTTVRQQYDAIIIDSPTAGLLADADIIEHQADCTLFVIRAGRFDRRRLEELKPVHSRDKQDKPQYVVLNGVNLNVRYGFAYLHKYERTESDKNTVELSRKTIMLNQIIFRKKRKNNPQTS